MTDRVMPAMRLGIIGLGGAAKQMMPSFLSHPHVRISAAADPREEARLAFGTEFGARTHATAEALCADTTVDDRASMPCLRHHGYASASQIVSIPASSITRAEASISSRGSIVNCITPIRNGTAATTTLLASTVTCHRKLHHPNRR